MSDKKLNLWLGALISGVAYIPCINAQDDAEGESIEEIVISGVTRTYSALRTTQSMEDQQNPITSVLSTIDNPFFSSAS